MKILTTRDAGLVVTTEVIKFLNDEKCDMFTRSEIEKLAGNICGAFSSAETSELIEPTLDNLLKIYIQNTLEEGGIIL